MLIQAAIIKSDHLLFWSTRHSPAPSGSFLCLHLPSLALTPPWQPMNKWTEHLLGVKTRAGAGWSLSVAHQDEIHLFPQPLSLKTSRFCYLQKEKKWEKEHGSPSLSGQSMGQPDFTKTQEKWHLCIGVAHSSKNKHLPEKILVSKWILGFFCLALFLPASPPKKKKYSSQTSALRHSLNLVPYLCLT